MLEIADLNLQYNGIGTIGVIFLFFLSAGLTLFNIFLLCCSYDYDDFIEKFKNKKLHKILLLRLFLGCFIFFNIFSFYLTGLFFIGTESPTVKPTEKYATNIILEKNNRYLITNPENENQYLYYYKSGDTVKTQILSKNQAIFHAIEDDEQPRAEWEKTGKGNWLCYYYKHNCNIYLPEDLIPAGVSYTN